ncbi:hypothetical protein BJV74DRAFT_888383 [Russula compacta]|nr:hypothetical protein BJV74DRAFT_888383 [Russula compacta]
MSATDLFYLSLWDIPIAGYISPEAMATCLATLASLEWLYIGFQSPRSRPDRIGLPPPTRAVLPALSYFEFSGVNEYLEDFVARIHTPKLDRLRIHLFMDLFFHIPQLHEFITRTETIRPLNPAKITFSNSDISLNLGSIPGGVGLSISCREPDQQVSSMVQVCRQLSPLLSHVERLDVHEFLLGQAWKGRGNGIDRTQLLELFGPFSTVQHLHIQDELRSLFTRALQGLTGDRATEVLPTLRNIFFGRLPERRPILRENIQAFIAARRHSDHPVDVHWE